MTADLEALVVAAYVVADGYPVVARPGRRAKISDAELVSLAVCTQLPEQSQYNRRWDARGLPLGYTLVPAGEKEYEPLADLLSGTPSEVVIADKGLWGRAYRERLAAAGVELLTPAKQR